MNKQLTARHEEKHHKSMVMGKKSGKTTEKRVSNIRRVYDAYDALLQPHRTGAALRLGNYLASK